METNIAEAFTQIKRQDFVPEELKQLATFDEALPIGAGQTISQPFVVRFMLEKLQPKEGNKILDIGSGSGWTTALLASIVGKQGKVVGMEIIESLKEFGEKNVAKYNFIEKGIAKFVLGNGKEGYEKEAPYDAILVSASLETKKLPGAWGKQLKMGGRIVVPIENSIWLFTKKDEHSLEEQEHPGFAFVPFVS